MSDVKHSLGNLGFHDKEIEIYLSLLELGSASYTELARKTGINRSTLYPLIGKLQERGVVRYEIDNKVLTALPPEELFTQLQGDVLGFHRLVPQLKDLAKKDRLLSRVKFFSGVDGIKQAYMEHEGDMPPKDKRWRYVIADITTWASFWEKHDSSFLPEWFRHNKKMGYKCKVLWSGQNKAPFKNGSVPEQDIEGRFLPEDYKVPLDLEIRPHYIVIASIHDDEPYAIKIVSTELASAMQNFFEFSWATYQKLQRLEKTK